MSRPLGMRSFLLATIGAGFGLFVLARGRKAPIHMPTGEERLRFLRLLPQVQLAAADVMLRAADRGVLLFVGKTFETADENQEMYDTGRSATTHSWHRVRRAIDFYVLNPVTGKIDTHATREADYRVMHEEAERAGFRVLGFRTITNPTTGKTFTDPYHVELREGLTWTEAARQLTDGVVRA